MAGFEPRLNNRGNYACPYCKHKAWKGKQAGINHIKSTHPKEAEIDQKRLDSEKKEREANSARWQAEAKASRLERELAEAKKAKPAEKKWWESGQTNVFCTVERIVFTNVRMPYGVEPSNTTCHSCGNRSLMMVDKVS
jgi:DNA-directed RNA polymerase subunit RPC12/RpoP